MSLTITTLKFTTRNTSKQRNSSVSFYNSVGYCPNVLHHLFITVLSALLC
jgi:hypothetical protein